MNIWIIFFVSLILFAGLIVFIVLSFKTKCPSDQHYDTTLKMCVPTCSADKRFSAKSNSCISCKDTQYYDQVRQTCVDTCSEGSTPCGDSCYYKSSGDACINNQVCRSIQVKDPHTCCPPGQAFLFDDATQQKICKPCSLCNGSCYDPNTEVCLDNTTICNKTLVVDGKCCSDSSLLCTGGTSCCPPGRVCRGDQCMEPCGDNFCDATHRCDTNASNEKVCISGGCAWEGLNYEPLQQNGHVTAYYETKAADGTLIQNGPYACVPDSIDPSQLTYTLSSDVKDGFTCTESDCAIRTDEILHTPGSNHTSSIVCANGVCTCKSKVVAGIGFKKCSDYAGPDSLAKELNLKNFAVCTVDSDPNKLSGFFCPNNSTCDNTTTDHCMKYSCSLGQGCLRDPKGTYNSYDECSSICSLPSGALPFFIASSRFSQNGFPKVVSFTPNSATYYTAGFGPVSKQNILFYIPISGAFYIMNAQGQYLNGSEATDNTKWKFTSPPTVENVFFIQTSPLPWFKQTISQSFDSPLVLDDNSGTEAYFSQKDPLNQNQYNWLLLPPIGLNGAYSTQIGIYDSKHGLYVQFTPSAPSDFSQTWYAVLSTQANATRLYQYFFPGTTYFLLGLKGTNLFLDGYDNVINNSNHWHFSPYTVNSMSMVFSPNGKRYNILSQSQYRLDSVNGTGFQLYLSTGNADNQENWIFKQLQ